MDSKIDCEWGASALDALQDNSAYIVIVDLFSFSTCVDIVTSQNAQVLPYHYDYNLSELEVFAKSNRAEVAKKRGEAGFTLSPQTLIDLPTNFKLVLPSPNGSTLCYKARHKNVLIGCLRNADAIANTLNNLAEEILVENILVVPAGEKWPDSSLRVAYEDLIAAGAIIAKLNGRKSFEALQAEKAFYQSQINNYMDLYTSKSGRELIAWNYENDVELALQYNVSNSVPGLVNGLIRNIAPTSIVGV